MSARRLRFVTRKKWMTIMSSPINLGHRRKAFLQTKALFNLVKVLAKGLVANYNAPKIQCLPLSRTIAFLDEGSTHWSRKQRGDTALFLQLCAEAWRRHPQFSW